uniref:Uncharacterized protein n=1 Tax=viral metagenome TaxID=1070528 RepID=A0A6C0LGC3_9ZZZZ
MTKTKPKKYRTKRKKGGVLDDKFKEIFKKVDDYLFSTASENKINKFMIGKFIILYTKEIIKLPGVKPLIAQLDDFIGEDNNQINRGKIAIILSNIKKIVEEKYDKKLSLKDALEAQQSHEQEPREPIIEKKSTSIFSSVARAAKSAVNAAAARFSFRRDTNSLGANIKQIKINYKEDRDKDIFIEKLRKQLREYAIILLHCNAFNEIDKVIKAILPIKEAIKTLNKSNAPGVSSLEAKKENLLFKQAFTSITSVIDEIKKESKTKPKTTDEIDAITVKIQEAIIELIISDEIDDTKITKISELLMELIEYIKSYENDDVKKSEITGKLIKIQTNISLYNKLDETTIKNLAGYILDIYNNILALTQSQEDAPQQEEEEEPSQKTKKTVLGRIKGIFTSKPKSGNEIYVLFERIKIILEYIIDTRKTTYDLYASELLPLYKDLSNITRNNRLKTIYEELEQLNNSDTNYNSNLDQKFIDTLTNALTEAKTAVGPIPPNITSLLEYRATKAIVDLPKKSNHVKYTLNVSESNNTDIIANIEANSSLLFSRLKTFILLDIKNYITYLHNNYDSEPKCKRDLNKLMYIFIPFIYMFIDGSGFIHTDDNNNYDYKKVNYKLFKDLLSKSEKIPETLNDLFNVNRNSLINDIISIIELLLLSSNYLNLNYLYSQICINIYLYETKNSGNILSNKHIPKKIDSILHFIMRLFTNTLCYYLYNVYMHTGNKTTTELNHILTIVNHNIATRDMNKFKDFNEESIYEIHKDGIHNDELLLILTRLYYENSKKCTYARRMYGGYGVEAIKLVDMSYEKPSYLLNHTIMDLCHLLKFYESVKKEVFNKNIKPYSDAILNEDIKKIYIDIIKENQ